MEKQENKRFENEYAAARREAEARMKAEEERRQLEGRLQAEALHQQMEELKQKEMEVGGTFLAQPSYSADAWMWEWSI